ncbi:ISL3 family transposase [Actinopolymorpha singaporensis]|uniref:Transposase n=1 Tax=Actinopolymorpha singaporensis TaxID=117157 RepID=A0A1H1PXZ4_9ACTN|nr:ISL3 family transposase [Actinopolymorpha singaporensis]SDS16085.1 Transposase [Actinopolymorpha singaporensis]
MRVSTVFNRILGLPGASVCSVGFTGDGLVVGLRRRRGRRYRCPCGYSTRARYDISRRRWRHLDFGATKVWLEADIARIACPACGIRTETVPWARPNARHTRDFQDVIGWLAQRMDKTSVARLLRCSWEAVDRAVRMLVAEHLPTDRLDGLYRIGVDEISYKRGHHYLTIVCDHDTGRVVWVTKDRTRKAFTDFFTALGPDRSEQLTAITMDGSPIYMPVAEENAPQAAVCLDPFHVIKWANEALDKARQANPAIPPTPATPIKRSGPLTVAEQINAPAKAWRRLKTALRSGAENLTDERRALINALRRHNYQLFRSWTLKEQLRDLYRIPPEQARRYLKRWIIRAFRSTIPAMHQLATRLTKYFEQTVAAVELGLSNSRAEGINSKIRVIQRRGYGHPGPDSLTAMIYLCLGGITLNLPTQT